MTKRLTRGALRKTHSSQQPQRKNAVRNLHLLTLQRIFYYRSNLIQFLRASLFFDVPPARAMTIVGIVTISTLARLYDRT